MKNIISAVIAKSNVISAAMVLTGCLCAWGYLAAQSDGEKTTSPAITPATGSLLEIKEPSQEDFEHCAQRAVDFLESISDNPTETDLALQVFFGNDLPLEAMETLPYVSEAIVHMKREQTFGRPELIAQKNVGANNIILCYTFSSGRFVIYSRFDFWRSVDENGKPQEWTGRAYNQSPDIDFILHFTQ